MHKHSDFEVFGLKLLKKVNMVYPKYEVRTDEDFATIYDGNDMLFRISRKQNAYWTFSGDNGTKCNCLDEAFDLAFKTCKMFNFVKGLSK